MSQVKLDNREKQFPDVIRLDEPEEIDLKVQCLTLRDHNGLVERVVGWLNGSR